MRETRSQDVRSSRQKPWTIAFNMMNATVFIAWIVLPFVFAGSTAWVAGWRHLAVVVVGTVVEGLIVSRLNPTLAKRRKQIGEGTKPWDLLWNLAFWPLMAAIAIVAGMQKGAEGPSIASWLWPVGLVVVASGFSLSTWAMSTNRHFEGTVRIQSDIGHQVFEGGPYRKVRHPGYVGLVLWALGSPLLLQSAWSVGAALVAAGWIVTRTALEDATLRRELPGYAEYARRTRFRLLPGVW